MRIKLLHHRGWTIGAAVVLLIAAVAVPVWAHHAFSAEFDANKPLKLRGTVTRDGMDQSPCLDPYRRQR